MRSDRRLPRLKRAHCVSLSFSRAAAPRLSDSQVLNADSLNLRVTFSRLGRFQTITKMWKSAGAPRFDAAAPTIEINE